MARLRCSIARAQEKEMRIEGRGAYVEQYTPEAKTVDGTRTGATQAIAEKRYMSLIDRGGRERDRRIEEGTVRGPD